MKVKRMEKIYNEYDMFTEGVDLKFPSLYVFYMDNEKIYSLSTINIDCLEHYIYKLKNRILRVCDNDLFERWKKPWSFDSDDYEEENHDYWDFESEDDINEMINVLEYIKSLNIEK